MFVKRVLSFMLAVVTFCSVNSIFVNTAMATEKSVDSMGNSSYTVNEDGYIEMTQEEYEQFVKDHPPIKIELVTDFYTGEIIESNVISGNIEVVTEKPAIVPYDSFRYYTHTVKHTNSQYTMNLVTDITLRNPYDGGPIDNRQDTIDSADASFYIDGFTMGIEIGKENTFCQIASDKKSCRSVSRGQIDMSFLVDGIIKLHSEPYEITDTIKLPVLA